MRKRIFGRKFKKDVNQRKALFRSLMRSMILEGKIKTTEAKAAAIRGELEKLVTKAAKKGTLAENTLKSRLVQPELVTRMIEEIGPKFLNRSGGYTRVIKLGSRTKDNAEIVQLEWVEVISKVKDQSQFGRDQKSNIKDKKQSEMKQKKEVVAEKPKKQAEKVAAPKPAVSKAASTTVRRTGSRGK